MSEKLESEMPVEQPRLVLLGTGQGFEHASQARAMGLKIGDSIRGKETYGDRGWNECRLTVLWIGARVVVYQKQWRAHYSPDKWLEDGEVANFTLGCREWYLEQNVQENPTP